jgi:anti-sigma factor RsiW
MEERLNDYLDGLLSEDRRREVESHLESCADCRQTREALLILRRQADELPRSLQPSRDLWPRIEAGLQGGRAPRARFPRLPAAAGTGWRPALAAAAVLILAVAIVVMMRPGPGFTPQSDAPGPAAVPAPQVAAGPGVLASFREAEVEYLRAVEALIAELEARQGELSPAARQVIEENLQIINESIREVWLALESDPRRPGSGHQLVELYKQKLELLASTVRLSPGTESSGRREESI